MGSLVRLTQFPPAMGLPSASPFCLKLETWLRMAGIPYENRYLMNPGKAPKGKFPSIEDGGQAMGDSGLIIEHLAASRDVSLDDWLSPAQKAVALGLTRLMEEHLYWVMMYARWLTPEGWAATRAAFFGRLPAPLAWIIPPMARRAVRAQFMGHGMGRHEPEAIWAMATADIDAIAAQLGDQDYLMGERPSTVDAVAYGFLANILWTPPDCPPRRHARAIPALEDYCQRMNARYWGDWKAA